MKVMKIAFAENLTVFPRFVGICICLPYRVFIRTSIAQYIYITTRSQNLSVCILRIPREAVACITCVKKTAHIQLGSTRSEPTKSVKAIETIQITSDDLET